MVTKVDEKKAAGKDDSRDGDEVVRRNVQVSLCIFHVAFKALDRANVEEEALVARTDQESTKQWPRGM